MTDATDPRQPQDEVQRRCARVWAWARAGDWERVRAAAADEDGFVRGDALDALDGAPPSLESLALLLTVSRADPESYVRERATYGLRRYREPAVRDRLLDALGDVDAAVRQSALAALVSFADAAPVDAILPLLGDEGGGGHTTGYVAATTLLEYGERVPLAPLLWRIVHPDWEHRNTYANELHRIERRIVADPGVYAEACEESRVAAMHVLVSMEGRAPAEVVLAALDHWLPSLRRMAVEWCGRWLHPVPVRQLLARLGDPNAEVRLAAARVLVGLEQPVLFAAACSLLEETDEHVQGEILNLVGSRLPTGRLLRYRWPRWGGRSYHRLLRELVRRPDVPTDVLEEAARLGGWEVRRDALIRLGGRPDATLAVLEAALQDRIGEVRAAAAGALRRRRGGPEPAAAPPTADQARGRGHSMPRPEPRTEAEILDLLEYAEPTISAEGLEALRRWPETFPHEPLLARLDDHREWVRRNAVRALAELGPRVPSSALLEAVCDTEPIAEEAIRALRRTHPEVLPELETEAIGHLRGGPAGARLAPLVEAFACRVIGSMADPPAEELGRISAALEHPNRRVREAALGGIHQLLRWSALCREAGLEQRVPLPAETIPRLAAVAERAGDAHLRRRAERLLDTLRSHLRPQG
ncbi:MAG TPA: HEAT repeat domain-containing protein [Candidatus Dormibacteraeota bacterium]|nr:HEAT repeat domain-containing protein [Candidatus Dormibacteraeota bacterium]